ncbi:ATP-grasp fold amidoligase family protein [Bacillus sp. AFS055030]|uniref:ATP-grasp fold amidoligase family protein n=1 Tax=Bacillus sp. AFS055030 TaxID=2033507 RepID=UPI000BFD27E2|nr:ATP-grasp fold amidoligase family protein [Bacillus sp. AFS055030]PGL72700.1 glycosyl transferase [Bacillus sp. AFS055030]
MNIIDKFKKDPSLFMIMSLGRVLPDTVGCDAFYLKLLYKNRMKKKLELTNPQTYNEKLQWLKLYNRRPEYTMMVDKFRVKEYVASVIGEDYIIPTLGIWERFDDIDFDKLPNQFVLKCTHDSGGLVICKDKTKLDKAKAKKQIERCLKRKYFLNTREWPYKDVLPRIIAEKYMDDESGNGLNDYKFFAFDGIVKAMYIATDRGADTETCFDYFDRDFVHLPFRNGYSNSQKKLVKPENYEKMIELAERLSRDMPHARIDFYNINGKVYFGEITFYHWSGMKPFEPQEWDYKFGDWINLPKR